MGGLRSIKRTPMSVFTFDIKSKEVTRIFKEHGYTEATAAWNKIASVFIQFGFSKDNGTVFRREGEMSQEEEIELVETVIAMNPWLCEVSKGFYSNYCKEDYIEVFNAEHRNYKPDALKQSEKPHSSGFSKGRKGWREELVTQEQEDLIYELLKYHKELSCVKIAKKAGVSHETVYRRMHEYGEFTEGYLKRQKFDSHIKQIEEVKAYLREHPETPNSELRVLFEGIDAGALTRARKELNLSVARSKELAKQMAAAQNSGISAKEALLAARTGYRDALYTAIKEYHDAYPKHSFNRLSSELAKTFRYGDKGISSGGIYNFAYSDARVCELYPTVGKKVKEVPPAVKKDGTLSIRGKTMVCLLRLMEIPDVTTEQFKKLEEMRPLFIKYPDMVLAYDRLARYHGERLAGAPTEILESLSGDLNRSREKLQEIMDKELAGKDIPEMEADEAFAFGDR